eukprot:scaffold3081_cov165-Skeletonema_marinoi.AAC.1
MSIYRLGMPLSRRQHKSLTRFVLDQYNLDDDSLSEITAALSDYSSLGSLCVMGNQIRREGCLLLGTIFGSADKCYHSTQRLSLSRIRSITAAGLRALSHLFSSACPVETLFLEEMNIGDEGAEALSDGLLGSTTSKHLVLTPNSAGSTQ